MSLAPKQPLAQKRSTPNIRSLQAAFEGPPQADHSSKHPHAIYPPNTHRSNAGDLAPSANVSSNRISSLTNSIDSVLDTPAAAPSRAPSPPKPNRPLARLRPSWIGPQPSKPMKTDIAGKIEMAVKQRVSIDFTSPGLQPPVYIFTSLSDPQWEAMEMFPVKQMSGEFTFVRNFDVEEGEYQYKFRLGPGDWWVCDEGREVVDDGAGNRNNRVVVKGGVRKAVDSGHASPEREAGGEAKTTIESKPTGGLLPKPSKFAEPVMTPPVEQTRELDLTKPAESVPPPVKDSQAAKAEVAPAPVKEPPAQSQVKTLETVAPPVKEPEAHKDDHPKLTVQPTVPKIVQPEYDFESEAEPYEAPLLRHESLSPTSHEQDHSPLFRHESIALGYNHHEDAAPHSNSPSPQDKPASPDAVPALHAQDIKPNESSLHQFPTDHEGIMSHIARAHTRLPEDMVEDVITSSPALSAAITDASSQSGVPSLPSVYEEDDDEQLEKIREAGEKEAQAEQENGEELDPLKEGEAAEAEDADFEPKIPELKVVVVPKVEKTTEEVVIFDRRPSLTEKYGTRNLMAVAVGLLAIIAASAVWKLFR